MATIRDVARNSGVSTATVSNVLNGKHDRVSQGTRDRVLAAVRELRYRPTALEDRQKAILTRNIGLMVGNLTKNPLSHTYFTEALNGVLEVSALRGFSTTIFVEKMWDDVGHHVRRSYDGRCDGLINVAPDMNSEVVSSLQARGTPMVLIGTTASLPNVASVDIDNESAGRQLAMHMLELGHSRFAFFGPSMHHASGVERERGFRTAILANRPIGLVYRSFGFQDHRPPISEQVEKMLLAPLNELPTAIVGWNDGDALEVVNALRERHIDISKIAFAGVDNTPDGQSFGLTTIENPTYLLGKRAANLLIEHAQDHTLPTEVVRFPANLLVRSSSVPYGSNGVYSSSKFFGSNGGSK
ncbi:MAG: LacI family DNA-binding transcriptional regulator [Chlorobia bacterium]|nr:LacI family DNA-binding transcriptional regulator [Fimbriimonadaceae bacterium]